jgi:5'-deoxynucleotidase YfbR-like HD superfamily hydrolase
MRVHATKLVAFFVYRGELYKLPWRVICYDLSMSDASISTFQLPPSLPGISDIAYTALQLAALSSRLALENRTLVNHITGRPENVAEHSNMLAIVAPGVAELHYPELDANLISRFASIHDAVEAYVGDTTTHNITDAGLKAKAAREVSGLKRFKKDFAIMPGVMRIVEQYEAQEVKEARFVRIIDKWMPVLVHFGDKGQTVRSYTVAERLVDDYAPHAQRLKGQFPDFIELVSVREELTELVAKYLF